MQNASVVLRNPIYLLPHLWINVLSTMGKKIQAVLESDADCNEETIDQPMLDVPNNSTFPALDGFESDSNFANEAPNPRDGNLPMAFMIRVHIQSPIPFSMMIATPICIRHQRRQKHLDLTLKRRFASFYFSKFKGLFFKKTIAKSTIGLCNYYLYNKHLISLFLFQCR